MNISLRKRTKPEIYISEKAGDYTGGYNFLAWLIWARTFFFIVFPGALAFAISFIYSYFPIMATISFALAAFYVFILAREYSKLKKGINTL